MKCVQCGRQVPRRAGPGRPSAVCSVRCRQGRKAAKMAAWIRRNRDRHASARRKHMSAARGGVRGPPARVPPEMNRARRKASYWRAEAAGAAKRAAHCNRMLKKYLAGAAGRVGGAGGGRCGPGGVPEGPCSAAGRP